MTAFDDAIGRVQEAATTTGAQLRDVRWSTTASGNDTTWVATVDCASYAAMSDQLGAKNDGGRHSIAAGHRIYDALTNDNRVVIEHQCWRHLDCWGTP